MSWAKHGQSIHILGHRTKRIISGSVGINAMFMKGTVILGELQPEDSEEEKPKIYELWAGVPEAEGGRRRKEDFLS